VVRSFADVLAPSGQTPDVDADMDPQSGYESALEAISPDSPHEPPRTVVTSTKPIDNVLAPVSPADSTVVTLTSNADSKVTTTVVNIITPVSSAIDSLPPVAPSGEEISVLTPVRPEEDPLSPVVPLSPVEPNPHVLCSQETPQEKTWESVSRSRKRRRSKKSDSPPKEGQKRSTDWFPSETDISTSDGTSTETDEEGDAGE
jgi:hypothetical protein